MAAEANTATAVEPTAAREQRGLKILFLSSDTGGGHRASAESLAKQFQILFPGTTYDLVDLVSKDGGPPYNSLVSYYKHLSAHPSQWKILYNVSNTRAFEMLADTHAKLSCERAVRKTIKEYAPDVVISVHPMMTNVPVLSCSKISKETGLRLPMFTVVTDLGSAHCMWFANGVEKMFVGSEKVKELARVRGKVPEEKLILLGLPIRHDFALQSEQLGDRMSPAGRAYQQKVRADLDLPFVDRKTLLVMGGGEGVGSLSNIVDALYVELVAQEIDAIVIVICGRNEKLKQQLEQRDWIDVCKRWSKAKERQGLSPMMSFGDACIGGGTGKGGPKEGTVAGGQLGSGVVCMDGSTVAGSIRRILSSGSLTMGAAMLAPIPPGQATSEEEKKQEPKVDEEEKTTTTTATEAANVEVTVDATETAKDTATDKVESNSSSSDFGGKSAGSVTVVPLGFVSRMAEYMVAADVLVSKAGPGTISEAAALSLPVMLTSFLPGQEEGNVDFVVEGGFGAYVHDNDPIGIAEEVCMWLSDEEKMKALSKAAKAYGKPYAARDIAKIIGESTVKTMELNDEIRRQRAESGTDKKDGSRIPSSSTF